MQKVFHDDKEEQFQIIYSVTTDSTLNAASDLLHYDNTVVVQHRTPYMQAMLYKKLYGQLTCHRSPSLIDHFLLLFPLVQRFAPLLIDQAERMQLPYPVPEIGVGRSSISVMCDRM